MIIYIRQSSPKKKPSKAVLEANRKHKIWLEQNNYLTKSNKQRIITYNMENVDDKKVAPMSNTIPAGIAAKRSIDDHRWKRDWRESQKTIDMIEDKKKRVAPLYNKGATQYISDGEDPKTLGRKL